MPMNDKVAIFFQPESLYVGAEKNNFPLVQKYNISVWLYVIVVQIQCEIQYSKGTSD